MSKTTYAISLTAIITAAIIIIGLIFAASVSADELIETAAEATEAAETVIADEDTTAEETAAESLTEAVSGIVSPIEISTGAAEEVRRQTVDEIAASIMKIVESASPEEAEYIRRKVADGVAMLDAGGLGKIAVILTNHSDTVAAALMCLIIGLYFVWRDKDSKRSSAQAERVAGTIATINNNAIEAQTNLNTELRALSDKLAASDDRCEKLIAENAAQAELLHQLLAASVDNYKSVEAALAKDSAASIGTLKLLSAMINASEKMSPEIRDRLYAVAQTAAAEAEGGADNDKSDC